MNTNIFIKAKAYMNSTKTFGRFFLILWLVVCCIFTLLFLIVGILEGDLVSLFKALVIIYSFATATFLIPAITITQSQHVVSNKDSKSYSDKSWSKTLLLTLLVGYSGAHRFYTGRKVTGFAYLFTAGGLGIGWMVDLILVLAGIFTDCNGNIIRRKDKSNFRATSAPSYTGSLQNAMLDKNEIEQKNPLLDDKLVTYKHESEIKVSGESHKMNFTPEQKNAVFSEYVVSGREETKQSIPEKIISTENTYTAQYYEVADRIPAAENVYKQTLEKLDSSHWMNTPSRKFINDMGKYADKVGKEARFVPFMQYWPTYESMYKPQKDWYFYWRSQVRAGRFHDTDLSYIFVHVYELLSGWGWQNALSGYIQLMRLWKNYRRQFPRLDFYLYPWIFDFTQLHYLDFIVPDWTDLALPTQPVILNIMIDKHSTDKPLKLSFALVEALCDYSIVKSKFYKEGNQLLINEAIPRVVALADAVLLKKNGKGILALYGPINNIKQNHYVFQSAVCPLANQEVSLSIYAYTSSLKLRSFINELVRHAENVLRGMYGYRGRLRGVELEAEMASIVEGFLKKQYALARTLENGSEQKADVKLDIIAIEALRAQSEAVRVALEVSDEKPQEKALLTDLQEILSLFHKLSVEGRRLLKSMYDSNWEMAISQENRSVADEINHSANRYIARSLIVVESGLYIVEDDYRDELEHIFVHHSELVDDISDLIGEVQEERKKKSTYFDVSRLSENLEQFIKMLQDIHQEALWTILTEISPQERLDLIANEAMSMPEILIDEINDIATHTLDDILVDNFGETPYVIEQYEPELKNAVIMEVR